VLNGSLHIPSSWIAIGRLLVTDFEEQVRKRGGLTI
jgi:hypothetical protein